MQHEAPPPFVLRRPQRRDDEALARLWTDPVVMPYLGGVRPQARAMARAAGVRAHWGDHGHGLWALVVADRPVGLVGLERTSRAGYGAELTYLLSPELHGRGLMAAAAASALDDLPVRFGESRVCAVTQAANRCSRRLLARLGFHHVEDVAEFGVVQSVYSRTGVGRGIR